MFTNLRNRFIVIAVLIVAAGLSLWQNKRRTTSPTQEGSIVNLGLDLQGGMHLGVELDQSERPSADPAKEIDLALTVLRKRIDEFGVLEPLIQKVGDDRIVVELPGLKDPERAMAIVQRNAFLEFRITDKSQALDKALPSMDRALRAMGITAVAVGGAEKPSAVQELLGGDTTKAETADSLGPVKGGALSTLIEGAGASGVTAMPGEYAVKLGAWRRADSLLKLPEIRRLWPRGVDFKWSEDSVAAGLEQYRLLYALEDTPIVTGASLVNAVAQVDPLTNGAEVNFELDRAGGRRFGQETGRHVGDYMAIVLDGQVQGRPPIIQSRIDRQGRIQLSGRSLQEAQDLALTLRAGALPTPLKIVERREVGPSLGKDSIRSGVVAALVGTALVVLIMVGYYSMAGMIACGALVLYALFTFGTLSLFEATLTLPGLAGFILSIGIAVDANVLIFERMREELDLGKTTRLTVDEGFRHAMPAIIDSNLSTVLTALFLFQFGTGPVQGFAVTLIVGILASMMTAVFITRTFYLWWVRRNPDATTLSLGKLRLFHDANYDFIAMRRMAYGVTGALLALGLVFLLVRGITYSVEFTGGTLLQIKTPVSVSDDQLRAGLSAQGITNAEVQPFGAPGEYLIRARIGETATDVDNTQAAAARVSQALDAAIEGEFSIVRTESVGAKVGAELKTQAFMAIFFSFFAVLAYLAYRFEWRFGLAAVIATAHDVLMTIAFLSVMHIEVSLVVVAAFLTMVGYSLNDTIIIFDRVRENLHKYRRDDFVAILNRSINQTLPRSILTHGTTLGSLLALAIFGGEVIRPFSLVMFFGVFTGTFSSIFIAAPVLLLIEQRWPGADARGVRTAGKAAPAATNRPQTVG
ncbi:MAG: protein translocase subunit SecD [Gemmatimonadetes bacterium]|nr:protein translocase subunit SecD [Gemmatimonadota bacterium]